MKNQIEKHINFHYKEALLPFLDKYICSLSNTRGIFKNLIFSMEISVLQVLFS